MSCLTVQETSRGDYPGPPPLGPCRLLMTWTTENLLLLLIMVSQTCHFPPLSVFVMQNKTPIYNNSVHLVNFVLLPLFPLLPPHPHSLGLNEMVIETASSPGPFRNTQMSKAAQTHKLRKLRAPSKCRECDGLVVFHGAECEEVTFVTLLFFCFRANGTKQDHTMILC